MNKKRDLLYHHLRKIEFVIAAILTVILILVTVRIAIELCQSANSLTTSELFSQILSQALLLVIGVEFIKMIIKPTSENILEVIMLTITRSLIVDHTSMLACLLGVIALLLLFFIRKYLYCEIRSSETKDYQYMSDSISENQTSK